ncbi:hypothetical protein Tcan_00629, partial [Toxocara canis]
MDNESTVNILEYDKSISLYSFNTEKLNIPADAPCTLTLTQNRSCSGAICSQHQDRQRQFSSDLHVRFNKTAHFSSGYSHPKLVVMDDELPASYNLVRIHALSPPSRFRRRRRCPQLQRAATEPFYRPFERVFRPFSLSNSL